MIKSLSKVLLAFLIVAFISFGCTEKTPGSSSDNSDNHNGDDNNGDDNNGDDNNGDDGTPDYSYEDPKTICEENPGSAICDAIAGRDEMSPKDAKIIAVIRDKNQKHTIEYEYNDASTYNAVNTLYATNDKADNVVVKAAKSGNNKLIGTSFTAKYFMASNGEEPSPKENTSTFLSSDGGLPEKFVMEMAEKGLRGKKMIVLIQFNDRDNSNQKYYLNFPNFIVENEK